MDALHPKLKQLSSDPRHHATLQAEQRHTEPLLVVIRLTLVRLQYLDRFGAR